MHLVIFSATLCWPQPAESRHFIELCELNNIFLERDKSELSRLESGHDTD